MKFTKKQKQTIMDFFEQEFGINLFDVDVDNIDYVINDKIPPCEWLETDEDYEGVTYETDCENKFVCGDYEELYKTFRYCIYCGGKIKVKKRKSV